MPIRIADKDAFNLLPQDEANQNSCDAEIKDRLAPRVAGSKNQQEQRG